MWTKEQCKFIDLDGPTKLTKWAQGNHLDDDGRKGSGEDEGVAEEGVVSSYPISIGVGARGRYKGRPTRYAIVIRRFSDTIRLATDD